MIAGNSIILAHRLLDSILHHPVKGGDEKLLHLIFESSYVLSENNASHASTRSMYPTDSCNEASHTNCSGTDVLTH
jgi:hypothetical protein